MSNVSRSSRSGALLGDERGEVLLIRQGGGVGAAHVLVGHDGLDGERDLFAPRAALLVILVGHAQQFADHRDGDEVGELRDEIGVRSGQWREQVVDDLLHVRAQLLDDPRAEDARHDAAQPRVIGRVHEDHHLAERLQHRAPLEARVVAHEFGRLALPEGRRAECKRARVVAREDPRPRFAAEDGIEGAEFVVQRVRIAGIRLREQLLHDLVAATA